MSENKYDKRVTKHQIQRGILTKEEFATHLTELEDCAEFSEPTSSQFLHKFAEESKNAQQNGENS